MPPLQTFFHVLEEASLDTLKIIPILFAVYILVSYFEHNNHKYFNFFKKTKKLGPIIGATAGTIPQCGFSVVMADLYNKKNITLGTLIAVFIATSDEAIPILFSNYNFFVPMLLLILIKFAYAIFCGYLIDFILHLVKKQKVTKLSLDVPQKHEPCECGHDGHDHDHNEEHPNYCCADNIFIDAIIHTLKIALFIFIINLVMGCIVEFSGLNLSSLFSINKYIQPFITSAIGLIPNCFASVVLVEIYISGGITFASLISGLCTGAGVGLLVLFKANKNEVFKNIIIVATVYVLGVLLGLFISPFNFSF